MSEQASQAGAGGEASRLPSRDPLAGALPIDLGQTIEHPPPRSDRHVVRTVAALQRVITDGKAEQLAHIVSGQRAKQRAP